MTCWLFGCSEVMTSAVTVTRGIAGLGGLLTFCPFTPWQSHFPQPEPAHPPWKEEKRALNRGTPEHGGAGFNLHYLWEKPYPGTRSPILTHTLRGLVLGGRPALAQNPSLALANRTAVPEWNTSKHHSVQRGEAVTDTLRHGLSPFPKL